MLPVTLPVPEVRGDLFFGGFEKTSAYLLLYPKTRVIIPMVARIVTIEMAIYPAIIKGTDFSRGHPITHDTGGQI
jgi:hypothetical protein